MLPVARTLLLVGAGALIADRPPALQVLRASPEGSAAPTAPVTVTFDRPVAGSLDRTVDASRLLTIAPAVPGQAEWRDPVTIRFRPAAPLPSGQVFTVTVSDSFTAMDGSRLAEPFRFSFRVRGPRVLLGDPVGSGRSARWLPPDATFALVVDAPVGRDAGGAFVEMAKTCARPGPIRLRLTDERRITASDPYAYREAGGWDRDRGADSLRRVARFAPVEPLPRGCEGVLVVPASFDATGRAEPERWNFSTYGEFRLADARCGWQGGGACPTGPVIVRFSNPVRGADVARHLRLLPATPFTVSDTADTRAEWVLETRLLPRTSYAAVVDTALRDAFQQRLTGNPAAGFRSTGFQAAINYTYGRSIVERGGLRTLGVTYVNVDSLDILIAPVPDSLVPFFMGNEWRWAERIPALMRTARRQRVAVTNVRDRARVYGVRLPVPDARSARSPVLLAVQVSSRQLAPSERSDRPVALVQVTNLGVHAKVAPEEATVWVTGADDGRPRGGATVVLRDRAGRPLATGRTDAAGLVRLTGFRTYPADTAPGDEEIRSFDGYADVTLGADRTLVGVREYDPDLSAWRFNVSPAWGADRLQAAGAMFTERGIYRPGETIHAKAIVRAGMLGRLEAARDSLRWIFRNRDGDQSWRDTTLALSPFGTSEQHVVIPSDAKLGDYRAEVQVRRRGEWSTLAVATYRIAEYRPPEFLVDVNAPSSPRIAGDSLRAVVEARYLFGAPMARAAVSWSLRQARIAGWELEIPGMEGWSVGATGHWWEEISEARPVEVRDAGQDTLDAAGRLSLGVLLRPLTSGHAARATLVATVTDVNRQTVSASTSAIVHPAAFYIAAKGEGEEYFWRAGRATRVSVVAVDPAGNRITGVPVTGVLERQEWHRTRRERGGYSEEIGEWVTDTVARCSLTTATEPATCRFVPPEGGAYTLRLTATDVAGRAVATSFHRWTVGEGWVPWNDESQFRMDVVPDRTRYSVGDTATVLFASPFTGAEAWVTLEREGLIEQRRLTVTSGTTTLRFPITEAHAPNVFVSIVVARGRSERPGPLDDPGRPTIRVGYAELRVTPESTRLTVEVMPQAKEYRPGDSARVRVRVRGGGGARSEVTLWAVDEGVLALTGYRTPDPLDLIYQPRGLGLRLASNLTAVAPQIPAGEKGGRNPGGGGGADRLDVLRSRFQTTAFFLGSVITDADGNAVATTRLPDNLTTFRVMAVAVTAGDRFGSGSAPMLVTKPLLARPALPRFVRAGDRLTAGVVVNARAGGTPSVTVRAAAEGARVVGSARRSARLEEGRGREVRFGFTALEGDSARFRFDVNGAGSSDAVRLAIPVRPAFHTRSYTIAGVLHDTASADLVLPEGLDPRRSTLELSFGTSPLPLLRDAREWFEAYPYGCSEQLASGLAPLVALVRAGRAFGADSIAAGARRDAEGIIASLVRRQRDDGGIGMWSAASWSSPWITAYIGTTLLDAREAGIPVSDSVLARIGRYLRENPARNRGLFTPLASWYGRDDTRLADRVAAVDFLARIGARDRASENELVRLAAQLAWEDRVRLAGVLARSGDVVAARRLLEPAWASVRVEGRRAVLPDQARRDFYIYSPIRPAAYLLRATLAVDPGHRLIGPLVEALLTHGRTLGWRWNTQDMGTAMRALAEFQERQAMAGTRSVRVRAGRRVVVEAPAGQGGRSAAVPLEGLLAALPDGRQSLRLALDFAAGRGEGDVPAFYFLTVTEVPRSQPVRPDYQGIVVERWYERYSDGRPVTTVAEGELVRVRLRVTVAAERTFVVLDDALPAGLEAIDLSLRTAGGLPGPGAADSTSRGEGENESEADEQRYPRWAYGSWDAGWWSPWEHRELRDDRIVYYATVLWPGTYSTTYVARATTAGTFVRPPAHAEEMYNPSVFGRTDGGIFTVTEAR